MLLCLCACVYVRDFVFHLKFARNNGLLSSSLSKVTLFYFPNNFSILNYCNDLNNSVITLIIATNLLYLINLIALMKLRVSEKSE